MTAETETETAKTKRRHGPAPLPKVRLRDKRVNVFFSQADYLKLVTKAGGSPLSVPAYIRDVALKGKPAALPAVIPETNYEAWAATAGLANNLNQLAKALNSGADVEIVDVLKELAAFRLALLTGGLKPEAREKEPDV